MSLREPRLPANLGTISNDTELASRDIDIRNQLDREYLNALAAGTDGDAPQSWLNYRRTPEVRYALARSARIAGYARFIAVQVNPKGEIIRQKEQGVEAEIVNSITSRFGGTRGLIERYYTLMKVPGQGFLAQVRERADGTGDPDGYWVLSASEVNREGDAGSRAKANAPITWNMRRKAATSNDRGAFTRLIQAEDFRGRIWVPDHEFIDDVNSPMQTLNPICEQLHTLTETISGRLRQRFALAGILLIPNEINDAAISGNAPRDALYSNDKVMNYLIHVMTTNVVNHAQGIAQIPILLKGPAAVLDKVKHIVMEAQVAETDLKLRAELIGRLLTGLDQHKQSVNGAEDSNHWCVDERTEVLSQRGWLRHDEVQVGDVILTLNHETGASEWQPVLRLYRADVVDEEMLSTRSGKHNSLTTMCHRWPVLQRTTEGMVDGFYRRWRTSAELNSGSQVIAAAPSADQPTEQKWSDDWVELVAWMWTEGSFGWREGRTMPKPTIAQSEVVNPGHVARIERCLRNLYGPPHEGPMPSSRRGPNDGVARWRKKRQDNGMVYFVLNGAIGQHLHAICPHRQVDLDFVREMTPSQLELFIDVSVMADGHQRPVTGQRTISQKVPAMLDAVELAAILAGYRVRRYERETQGFKKHTQHCLGIATTKTTYSFQKGGLERECYTGLVWCPTTANGSWMARRDGVPFFTGNSMWAVSDEERRITVQPDLEAFCHALTRMVLWKELRARDRRPGAITPWRVWYDLSAASVRSNLSEDARQAYDRGSVSRAFLRMQMGATDNDAPEPDEYVRMLGWHMKNPILATHGLEGVEVDWDEAAAWGNTSGPTADSPADDTEVGPGAGDPGSPESRDSDTPKTQEPG